jgi:hypothetical protein
MGGFFFSLAAGQVSNQQHRMFEWVGNGCTSQAIGLAPLAIGLCFGPFGVLGGERPEINIPLGHALPQSHRK